VRLTKGDQTLETPLVIGLDRRSTFTLADRQAQFDAAMKVHGLFGEMSDLAARIVATRDGANAAAGDLPDGDALKSSLTALAGKADAIRKKIVATKEGGAITGEQRLREHMDDLYGEILGYEGRPGNYMIERTTALQHELQDIKDEFTALVGKDLHEVNDQLKAKGKPEITLPEHAPIAWMHSGDDDTRPAYDRD
jgi:hypothetical protein